MRSLLRAALSGCSLLLAVACGGSSVSDFPPEPAVTTAPAPPPTATPTVPTADAELAPMTELSVVTPAGPLPIEQLAPGVADLIAASAGPIGVAVVVPEQGVAYVGGESRPFPLASAVKVPLMLAVLERARLEGRDLLRREEEQVQAMITRSDNVSTTTLWTDLGGGEGVDGYLGRVGQPEFDWGKGRYWGDTAASAHTLAELLAQVLEGGALGSDEQAAALSLLENVAADQRWGVSAGLNLAPASEVRLGIKDGWYQEVDGWRLASAGLVRAPGGPDYAVVILTDRQPNFEEGVWTLERIAAEIHHALLPQPMTAALTLTDFAEPEPTEALVASGAGPAATPPARATTAATPQATPASTPSPTAATPSAPSVAFRPLEGAPGVLVPASAVAIAREQQNAGVSHWFQVPGASSAMLIAQYRSAMEQAGWSVQPSGSQLTLTSGGSQVVVGAHDQPDQAVLNLVVTLPHATASSTLAP